MFTFACGLTHQAAIFIFYRYNLIGITVQLILAIILIKIFILRYSIFHGIRNPGPLKFWNFLYPKKFVRVPRAIEYKFDHCRQLNTLWLKTVGRNL